MFGAMASQSITRARPGGVKGDPASTCLFLLLFRKRALPRNFVRALCAFY